MILYDAATVSKHARPLQDKLCTEWLQYTYETKNKHLLASF